MAKSALFIGPPGSGKSTSMMFLDPKTTFIINVQGKDLPFKSNGYVDCPSGEPKEGNLYYTDKADTIKKILNYVSSNREDIKTVVIDDYQYSAVNEYMRRIKEKGYDKFNDIGYGLWSIPEMLPKLRKDLVVFFLMHDETFVNDEGFRERKAKGMGKLIDQVVGGLEGFFVTVLYTDIVKNDKEISHYFVTQNEGDTSAKTPIGMFDELRIPNDLNLVDKTIREFYNI